MEESYKGFSKNAPSHLHSVMEAQYEIMGRPSINNAVKLKTNLINDKLKETSLSNINEAFKTLEQNASGMLSDDTYVSYDASRSAQLQMNTISNMSNSLTDDGVPLFSAEQRVRFLEKAKQSLVESGVKGWFDQQDNKVQAYKDFLNGEKSFKLYNENDELDTEIQPLHEMDRGTFEKVRGYMESNIKRSLKEQYALEKNARFSEMMSDPNLLIDPKNKEQRSMVDQHFDQVLMPQIAGMNPEERNSEIAKYVNRVGIIPSEVQSLMRASLRNGSVDNQIASADLISKLQETSPKALYELDGSDVSYGMMLTNSLRGGLTPDEAVSQTRELFNPLKEDVRKRRNEDFREIRIDSEKELADIFSKRSWSSLFLNETRLPKDQGSFQQAQLDYINTYREQYVLTGNAEIAKDRASTIIGRQYGVTNVTGGTRITKYPPEEYYAIDGIDNEWMSNQLVSDVSDHLGIEVGRDDIALVPDVTTAREVNAKENPSYVVMVRNDRGEYTPTHKDRNLMRYYFDPESVINEHNAMVETENKKSIATSKSDFERQRQKYLDDMDRAIKNSTLPPLPQEKF